MWKVGGTSYTVGLDCDLSVDEYAVTISRMCYMSATRRWCASLCCVKLSHIVVDNQIPQRSDKWVVMSLMTYVEQRLVTDKCHRLPMYKYFIESDHNDAYMAFYVDVKSTSILTAVLP